MPFAKSSAKSKHSVSASLPNPSDRERRSPVLCRVLGLVLSSISIAACGGSDPASPGGSTDTNTSPLLPLKTGNSWTYQVIDTDGVTVTTKITTVGVVEAIGGGPHASEMAFKVETTKGTDMSDQTISYQGVLATNPQRIVRYRELSYGAKTKALELEEYWEPHKLHIDGSPEKVVAGGVWAESYIETKLPAGDTAPPPESKVDMWSVVSIDESVTVPWGTFPHSIRFKKEDKEYWYARGIGKLKETGGQTESLVSATIDGKEIKP